MATEEMKPSEDYPSKRPDPFPEPRTYPKNWDLSEVASPTIGLSKWLARRRPSASELETDETPKTDQTPQVPSSRPSKLDSKSKPLPSKWDLSELC